MVLLLLATKSLSAVPALPGARRATAWITYRCSNFGAQDGHVMKHPQPRGCRDRSHCSASAVPLSLL